MDPTVAQAPPVPTEGTYARQDSLNLSIPSRIIIVGCGGVGSWLSYFLALAGCPELWLWDHDTVNEHNLNRLPLTPESIGESKSDALATLINMARPDCRVYSMSDFTTSQAIAAGLEYKFDDGPPPTHPWLVCTTDTWASRKLCYSFAQDNGYLYIEAAAEGEIGSITGAPADWATDDEKKPGYASVPVWVGPCVMAASMACAYILHTNKQMDDRSIRLGWIKPPTSKVGSLVYYDSSATQRTPQTTAPPTFRSIIVPPYPEIEPF